MGKVMQRAGGGRMTVEGLSAGVVKNGATVKIRQGSKVVQQVTGTVQVKRLSLPSGNGNVDMKAYLPNAWQTLTASNFAFATCSASMYMWQYAPGGYHEGSVSTSLSYNQVTGILTISGSTSNEVSGGANAGIGVNNSRSVVCYYCE